jgi:hypothetical protein
MKNNRSESEIPTFIFGICLFEYSVYKSLIWEEWMYIIGCLIGVGIIVVNGWIRDTSKWKLRPIWVLLIGLFASPILLIMYSAWRAGNLY